MHRSLTDVINCSSMLQTIMQRAIVLNKLSNVLPQIVPEISDCGIANINAGVLSIVTGSPATKHQLRYSTHEILAKAQQLLPQYCIKEIKIFVKPEQIAEQHKADLPKPKFSKATGECINSIIPAIKNSNLSSALQSLVKCTKI